MREKNKLCTLIKMWSKIQKEYRNSVFQIITSSAEYSVLRPYLTPNESAMSGSGFLIDVERGLVISNAHVVENAISIVGRCPLLFGRDITLRLISICREKDLSLLQIIGDDLSLIKSKGKLKSFILGDSFKLTEMTEVVSIGYPLGQDGIKFTQGVISGFQHSIDEVDDVLNRLEDTSTFIQITCPINRGNSGGPLVDVNGKVVGVCAAGVLESQNVGYAIPSNTVAALITEMIKPVDKWDKSPTLFEITEMGLSVLTPIGGEEICYTSGECIKTPNIIKPPKLNIKWCSTSKDLLHHFFSQSDIEGVLITKVYPDSVFFEELRKGDLLCKMCVKFDNGKKFICGMIDSYGTSSVDGIDRRLTIKDFLDVCQINFDMEISVLRKKESGEVECHTFIKKWEKNVFEGCCYELEYLHFSPIDYEILGGICFSNLSLKAAEEVPSLRRFLHNEGRYSSRVFINQIFSGSEISSVGCFKEGSVLISVNDIEVLTLTDLRRECEKIIKKNENIKFVDENGNVFVYVCEKLISDTQSVKIAYSLDD